MAVVVMVAAGCRGAGEPSAGGPGAVPTAGAPGTRTLVIPPDRLAWAMNDATDYQRRIIEDGTITFAEYERAALDTVACFHGLGLRVMSAPYLTSPPREGLILLMGDRYQFHADAMGREITIEEWAGAERCRGQFFGLIDALMIELAEPTLAEIQVARRELAACLLKAGIPITANPSVMELHAAAYPPDGEVRGRQMDPGYRACIEPIMHAHNIYVSGAAF